MELPNYCATASLPWIAAGAAIKSLQRGTHSPLWHRALAMQEHQAAETQTGRAQHMRAIIYSRKAAHSPAHTFHYRLLEAGKLQHLTSRFLHAGH